MSPKKLALNGNASTCEKTDIETEDDEGWIIDEGDASQPANTSEDQDHHTKNGENSNDNLIKGRRKQNYPKLSTTIIKPVIPASLTPMQGWRATGNPVQTHSDRQNDNLCSPSLHTNASVNVPRTHMNTSPQSTVSTHNNLTSNVSIPKSNLMPSNTRVSTQSDQIVMPVIDPSSVVSTAVSQSRILKPASNNNNNSPLVYAKLKPKVDTDTIGSQSVCKLINLQTASIYKPAVHLSAYKEYDAPVEGYNCKACGYRFLSERSLLAHLQRPSLLIKYLCDICCSQRSFYNKCSLWTHILSHTKNAYKNLDKFARTITVKPISRKQFLSYNFGASCPLTLQDYEATRDEKVNCPACSEKLQGSVSDHLGRFDNANMSECRTCKRLLKNPCERQLHKDVHDKGRYCPGCGVEHMNLKEYYQHGKSGSCLYWLSSPILVCWICCSSFYHLDLFMRHICNHHSLSYYKCTHCQLAFRNFNALNLHLTKDHSTMKESPGKPFQRRILKCPLCKNVFSNPEAIFTHFRNSHRSYVFERIKRVAYRCSLCPNPRNFVDRYGLLSHLKTAHTGCGNPVICDLCGKDAFSSVLALRGHRLACLQATWQVEQHVINSEDRQKTSIASLPTKTKRVLQCSLCPSSNKVFYSSVAGYKSHFTSAHSGVTPLPVEVDLVTTSSNPSKPGSNMQVNPSVVPTPKAVSTGSSKRSIIDVNAPSKDQQESKKIKLTPKVHRSCIKCGFNSVDWDKFVAHIKTHKENSAHVQCQECGLCFRSEIAVSRHMAMKHLIQTPIEPIAMPKFSPVVRSPVKHKSPKEEIPPPKVTLTPKVKSEAATMECTVCYRLFTTDVLLRNHMRTHGMAFIRSSKRSSTPKVEAV